MLAKYVQRMFPISFSRKDCYGARSLSESNLVSWLQNFSPDSAIPHSFVINESISNKFGLRDYATSNMSVEFIIGGYYVKLSDSYFTESIEGFTTEGTKTTSYYASIKFSDNGNNEYFRTLDGGESSNDNDGTITFNALTIHKVEEDGTIPTIPSAGDYVLHLFDLKQTNSGSGDTAIKQIEYIIPRTSLRTIDGGEI